MRPEDSKREEGAFKRSGWLIPAIGALLALITIACLCLALGPLNGTIRNVISPPVTQEQTTPVETESAVVTQPPQTEEPTSTVTETSSPEATGNGACNAPCDPANPTCLAGLKCLPVPGTAGKYVCWNDSICQSTTPAVTDQPTEIVTQPPQACGPGWLPASGCACCGTTLVCSDGTVAQFNPKCGVGGGTTAVCGNNKCEPPSETCWSCWRDCGLC